MCFRRPCISHHASRLMGAVATTRTALRQQRGFPLTGVAEFLPTPCRKVRSMVTFSQPPNVDMLRE